MLSMNSYALVVILRTLAKRTELCLSEHKNMHSRTKKALYINIFAIVIISNTQDLYNLPDMFTNENTSSTTVINKEFFAQTVRDNTNIIDRDANWNLLLYKEACHIKRLSPFLNNGLKASRELRLFS